MDFSHSVEHARLIYTAADQKQADDIVVFDVHEHTPFSDIVFICSADNERKVKSICDAIEDSMREHGCRVQRSEGRDSYRWVLLDFSTVIVHIFVDESREYFDLERLWKDCPSIDTTNWEQDHHASSCRVTNVIAISE